MKYLLVISLIVIAVLTRFAPHFPNLAPITAIAIFAGANLSKRSAVGLTLLVRLISDLVIGFFSWPIMIAVYVAHLLGVCFGLWIKHSQNTTNRWVKIIGSGVVTAVLFFVITNFAFLYSNYPHNWSGIMLSYVNGLPFLRGTVMGDVAYSVALFGSYELVKLLSKTSWSNSFAPRYSKYQVRAK